MIFSGRRGNTRAQGKLVLASAKHKPRERTLPLRENRP